MCIADLQVAARGTFKSSSATPTAGNVPLGDMSRALWISVYESTGVGVQVYINGGSTPDKALPRDTTLAANGTGLGFYHRQSCGPMFGNQLSYVADGVKTYCVTWLEMDQDTYSEIVNPPR